MRLEAREREFLTRCGTRAFGRDGPVEWHDELESTQDRARALVDAGAAEGTLVVAEVQNAGRGRKGDPWHSARGGVWASLVLRPKRPAQDAPQLTLLFARALRECLHYDFCLPASIKEPNDVLVGGRKIAGILADASSRASAATLEHMILGFGVNVANPLPPELEGVATSMATFLKEPPRTDDVLARVLERFEGLYLPRGA